MGAKDLKLKTISSKLANQFIKDTHYSGKVAPNSQLHFGVYYEGGLHGVMQYGPSINKKGTVNLVAGTGFYEFCELNRMAFDDVLPKNSESRAIAISLKLIKKYAPHIKWVISFADATSCGDGAIYRASGFKLVGATANTALRQNPDNGEVMHTIQAHHKMIAGDFRKWKPLQGFQIKYIFFIDKSCEQNLTLPVLPFSHLEKIGARMYKGKRPTVVK